MRLDSDAQAVIDQYAKFEAPPIETLSPENARNNPTLKNAVESMAAESAMIRTMNVAMPVLPEPVGSVTHRLIPSPTLADEQVLFLSDSLPTGWMAAENCQIEEGDTVAIRGCGPVGQFAIKSAWMLGAGRVIAIDGVPEAYKTFRDKEDGDHRGAGGVQPRAARLRGRRVVVQPLPLPAGAPAARLGHARADRLTKNPLVTATR